MYAFEYPAGVLLALTLAITMDRFLGEPDRWHPLVGFGNIANCVERMMSQRSHSARLAWLMGTLAVVILLGSFVTLTTLVTTGPAWQWLIDATVLYLAIGAQSLREHAQHVMNALQQDLATARNAVARMVSRDTGGMDSLAVTKATIESVLENGNDAIFGAIFWFLMFGAPGAMLYRLANTLDAMWGYRNERYLYFGWAAARLDDVLNWVPARLTALTYAAVGDWRGGFTCWLQQAKDWYSPNAGPVMAAGAGALNLQLGGSAVYGGAEKFRPVLGRGSVPQINDILRAMDLVKHSLWCWIAVSAALYCAVGMLK